MDGVLAKLIIQGFLSDQIKDSGDPVAAYVAMFNPENFSVSTQINYDFAQAHGTKGTEPRYTGEEPRTFTFEFLVDGTGAAGEKRNVLEDIAQFQKATGFSGDIHQPLFLILSWGTFVASCVLTSMTVNYKLFRPNGEPIRATIDATFREYINNELQLLINNLSSPDLTHIRKIAAGDTLDLMCQNIYENGNLYLKVASANRLDTVMTLKVGSELRFPPLEKQSS